MADEKDTEASRLAQEKFIPEFKRLSVEGLNNDDDGRKKTLTPKRKHGKTNIKIRLRKTSSEVSKKKEEKKVEKKDEKKDEKKEDSWLGYYPYDVSGYYGGSSQYNKEFGRDTNRLDAFPCRPLEVSYDPKYGESDYGGGHSGQQQHQQQTASYNDYISKSGPQQSAPSVNLVANDLRSSDSNGSWLGIQRQLLQLERQQAHIMNMLQDFKSESRVRMVTLENLVWGLDRVVKDMAHNLLLSMNNLKTSCYMNAFEESSGRSLSKYNGFSDYKSRGSSWNHEIHTRNTQIGLRKGGGPVRCGEGPSARSVWKASKNEATLEAIRGAAPEVSETEIQ